MKMLRYSPVLVITDDISEVLKKSREMAFPVIIGKAEEISLQLFSLRQAELTVPVVVGDINPRIAGFDIEQRLLKVLEDFKPHVIYVSSDDCFSEIFVSRFVVVTKNIPVEEQESNSKVALVQFLMEGKCEMKDVLREAPGWLSFYMSYVASGIPAKKKLLEML